MGEGRDPFLLPGDEPPTGEKLQKFLSAAGVSSRRHAEVLISQGRVTVNGEVARLGQRISEGDRVCVNGVEVGPQAPRLYLLNKPTRYVTTLDDPQGRTTVASLVPDDVRVYPVGRLDYDTSGLLLLTNDGELAHRLMHPSFGVEKTYRALVQGRVTPAVARTLASGVELEDGVTSPASARVIDAGAQRSVVELTIHEGRNRQVRRMCEAVGHPVLELVRTGYGPLKLGNLALGTWRQLTEQEVRRLRKAAGMAPPRKRRRSEGEAVEQQGEADAAAGGKADEQQDAGDGVQQAGPGAGGGGARGGAGKARGGSAGAGRRGTGTRGSSSAGRRGAAGGERSGGKPGGGSGGDPGGGTSGGDASGEGPGGDGGSGGGRGPRGGGAGGSGGRRGTGRGPRR